MPAPLSIVIPTLNAEAGLARTLGALVAGSVAGLVREVVVSDGGSEDETLTIAKAMGAVVIEGPKGRGAQLSAGARAARAEWLLFLHADTELEEGWADEVARFIAREADEPRAAAFTFALDDFSPKARRMERLVAWRCALFGLPYGDQGLLIPRALYDALGGYGDMPLMEDVDLVRRLGRRRLAILKTRAVTSAERYRREGWTLRPLRNLSLLALYFARVPPRILARLYG